jgi:hypothetical protein
MLIDDSTVELSGLDFFKSLEPFEEPPESFSRIDLDSLSKDARMLLLEERIDLGGLIGFEHMNPSSLGEKS